MTNKPHPPTLYKGRSWGIVVLTLAQILIGAIHVFSGLLLLSYELAAKTQVSIAYDVYTLAFGLLVLVFAGFLWNGKKIGWAGTIAALLFVVVADSLTLLNLPGIPGIPTFAAPTEIAYGVWVVVYLFLPHVRKKFLS